MTDIDGSVALHKRRCRTNLKNAELSKRTFRIFLEKQILSHVKVEIRKNTDEVQTPSTPVFDYNEGDLTLNYARLAFQPFRTTMSGEKSFIKSDLNLPSLEAEACPIDKAVRVADATINHDTNSEANTYEDSPQCKSKASRTTLASNQNTSDLKINKVTNVESSHILIYDNSPEWFQDNETASVHGSLLSEATSDTNIYNINLRKNVNHKRCRWKRILFCCVN
ncbi:hypothetical protein EAI_04285 [Harpegnathos saltator]|uniref:Uncharacterized protein n=1 Tax=Harpegnathos saltator TaxID=610380 RepID=E2BZ54_HARSA|nr:hypothetical protein EAI_04285 [Harpegnathos saltator]